MPDPRLDSRVVRPANHILDSLREALGDIRPLIDLRRDVVDGIFEGGGTLGTAYVGSLLALERHNIWFKRVAGTSAGAITAAMIAAGYSASEIFWLTCPPEARAGVTAPATLPAGAEAMAPISFSTFIDPPTQATHIPPNVRRQTTLWNLLNLTAIEEIQGLELDIVTRDELVTQVANAIESISSGFAAFRTQIEDAIMLPLSFYPNTNPSVGDFLPLPPGPLRRNFADAVWNRFTDENPWYATLVNVLYEGGYARGDAFRDTMRRLIGLKVANDANADVRFADLPVDLTVIGADTTRTEMVVYSARDDHGISVADAVRASMSIPMLFEPVQQNRHDIMDGGLFSNYPFWLFTGAGDPFVSTTPEDDARSKLGFLLLEDRNASPVWNAPAPKWVDRMGNGREPDIWDALEESAGIPIPPEGIRNTELRIIGRALRAFRAMDKKEGVLNPPLREQAKDRYPFDEIEIPLKGFSWVDFSVNEDAPAFLSMAFRGWEAMVRTRYFTRLVPTASRQANPFA